MSLLFCPQESQDLPAEYEILQINDREIVAETRTIIILCSDPAAAPESFLSVADRKLQ
jgi:hypothetical protein